MTPDTTLEPVCRQANALTVYAWVFRYPGDASEPTRDDVEDARVRARELHEAVIARLPAETHS